MHLKDILGKKPKAADGDMKESKLKALKEMRGVASEMMGSGLKSALEPKQAVTVAADSAEGLKEGLDKAEDILEDGLEMKEGMEDSMADSDEDEDSEDGEMSLEEIEKLERELAAMKQKMMSKA